MQVYHCAMSLPYVVLQINADNEKCGGEYFLMQVLWCSAGADCESKYICSSSDSDHFHDNLETQ